MNSACAAELELCTDVLVATKSAGTKRNVDFCMVDSPKGCYLTEPRRSTRLSSIPAWDFRVLPPLKDREAGPPAFHKIGLRTRAWDREVTKSFYNSWQHVCSPALIIEVGCIQQSSE